MVITTYTLERLKDLEELLDSLEVQTYDTVEIVFVGEGSRELCERVSAYEKDKGTENLRIVFNDGSPGLSEARNLGVQHARGDVIAFTDDDALPYPEWIEEIVKTLQNHPEAIGVTGPSIPLWQGGDMSWVPEELYWLVSCTPSFQEHRTFRVRNGWGVNMAYRREAFAVSRFSEEFGAGNRGNPQSARLGIGGEDTEFGLRIQQETGKVILFNPRIRVLNKVPTYRLSSRFSRRRAFWDGYNKATLRKRFSGRGRGNGFKLTHETAVLRRLLYPFLPRVLAQLLIHPTLGWRQLSLAVDVVFHTFLGFFAGSVPWPGKMIERHYSK